MKLLRILLASLAAYAVLAPPAHARTGNGLYEPFPSPLSTGLAQRFADALPGGVGFTDLSGLDLERGVFVGRPALGSYRAGRTVASRVRSDAGFAPSIGWPLGVALLVGMTGGVAMLAVRRA